MKPTNASSGSSTLALKKAESADLPTDPADWSKYDVQLVIIICIIFAWETSFCTSQSLHMERKWGINNLTKKKTYDNKNRKLNNTENITYTTSLRPAILQLCTRLTVQFQKISIPAPRMVIGYSKGERGLNSQQVLVWVWSILKLDISVCQTKITILRGGMDLFWDNTL